MVVGGEYEALQFDEGADGDWQLGTPGPGLKPIVVRQRVFTVTQYTCWATSTEDAVERAAAQDPNAVLETARHDWWETEVVFADENPGR